MFGDNEVVNLKPFIMSKTDVKNPKTVFMSIKDFIKEEGYTHFHPKVRYTPNNGYPYVTFYQDEDRTDFVMLSKGLASEIGEGVEEEVTLEWLRPLRIAKGHNSEGEPRTLLVQGTTRVSLEGL